MTSDTDQNGLVLEEIYHKSLSDLTQLQSALPEGAVVALAREVLIRMERQAKAPKRDKQSIFSLRHW